MLRVTLQLPPPGASDVNARELHVKINGTDNLQTLPGQPIEAKFDCEPDSVAELWLVDIDGSGNRSEESEHVTTDPIKDTFSPPAPGALAISAIEQV